MRKVIVEIKPNYIIKDIQKIMFEKVDSIRLLELLKLDFEHGLKVGLIELTLKSGYNVEDVDLPDNVKLVDILSAEGGKCTGIVKVKVPEEFKKMMKQFDLDLIWDTPMVMSRDKLVYSCIGDEENLRKFLEVTKLIGEVVDVIFKRGGYEEYSVLSSLTERQKEIILAAKKNGYYNYPRKTTPEKLAGELGISKATTLEHLRKAEVRIMSNLLAGF